MRIEGLCRCCDQPAVEAAGNRWGVCARCLPDGHRHTWVPEPTWEQLEARAAADQLARNGFGNFHQAY